jgi:hypothetical protein
MAKLDPIIIKKKKGNEFRLFNIVVLEKRGWHKSVSRTFSIEDGMMLRDCDDIRDALYKFLSKELKKKPR